MTREEDSEKRRNTTQNKSEESGLSQRARAKAEAALEYEKKRKTSIFLKVKTML